jgi:hypothetical protein
MTKDLFIDLNYRSGVSPSSCLHVRPNNELSSLMTNQHPITPPPELIREWCAHSNKHETYDQFWCHIATQAARWGADQELDACYVEVAWLESSETAKRMRERRRPEPPSLKEQALEALKDIECEYVIGVTTSTIRRALEQLDG